jgi:mono/diheme cytochrome c family protein
MRFETAALLSCLVLLLPTACDDGSKAGGATADADKIWQTRCVTCHGTEGLGDGPSAVGLDPKPRSFKDKKWQAEATDDGVKKAIIEGGAAVGKSALMAPNPDLKDKPEVVDALVKKVRGFR